MSYPYPEDRTREKREFEPKVYAENRETLVDADAIDKAEEELWGETHQQPEGDARRAQLKEKLEEEARRVQAQMQDEQAKKSEDRTR